MRPVFDTISAMPRYFIGVVLYLLLASAAFGQGATSRAVGTVTDATGAAIIGAKVQIVSEGTGATFETQSSNAGAYAFEALQPGKYTVSVEASGFRKFVSRGNAVTIGQPMTLNASLEIGAVTNSVEVVASAELVQTSTSGNMGNILDEKVLADLPIVGTRGRNALQLVLLQPGVADGANTGGGYHIHGARDRAWNYTLEGIDNNDPSYGGSNFAPTRTNPDMLTEYRVITASPTADVGRTSGANVVLVTKSGSNEFHGNGFWFYRTPRLNANEWVNNFNGTGKRMFVQNIYGGSLGGPIIKNRTFFFANIQRLSASETRSVNRLVYTADARKGILRYAAGSRNRPAGSSGASVDFSGNVLPGVNVKTYDIAANDPQRIGLDPTIRGLLGKTPLPNNFTGGDGLNTAWFSWTSPQFEKQQDNTIRVDHIFSPRNAAFFRGAWGHQNTVCDAANAGTAFFPGEACNVDTNRTPHNLAFSWRSNPTPRLTNEFIFGQSKFTFDFISPQAKPGQIFFSGGDGGGTVSNSLSSGNAPVIVENLSFAIGNLRTLRTRQFVDNLSYIHGSHSIKTGFNLRFLAHQDARGSIAGQNANQMVTFDPGVNTVDPATFGLPADLNVQYDRFEFQRNINFQLGRIGSTTRGFASDGQKYVDDLYRVTAQYRELEFYVQDSWKVRKNLMVDLGLRWEIRLAPGEKSGLIAHPDQPLVYGAPPTTTARWVSGTFMPSDLNNFGPSIGFAWDPFGTGKTSIRSNYRIAYDRLPTFGLSSAIFQNLPGITLSTVNDAFGQSGGRLASLPKLAAPATDPRSFSQPAAFGSSVMTALDPNIETATTHMWAFGVQREVMQKTVLSIDYIGRRAHNLYGAYNANQTEIFSNGFLNAFNVAKAGGESALLDQITRPDTRRTASETGAQYLRRQFATELSLNSVGAVANNLATRVQSGRNLTDLAGMGPFLFIPFPQFGGGMRVIDSNDFSTYHGVEVQLERRFANGVSAQLSWTFAKSLDSRSFDPVGTIYSTGSSQSAASTPFDIKNRKLNYARSDFDRKHVIQSYWVWELPFGKGRKFGTGINPVLDRIAGGWQLAGFLRYQTGRPFTVFSGANTLSNVNQSTADCSGCQRTDGEALTEAGSGLTYYFNKTERDRFVPTPAGSIGNTGRNFFQIAGQFNIETAISKRFYVHEKMNLEIRADITNLANNPTWDVPTATRTSGTFGLLRTPNDNSSRKIQLGAKFNF
jgi:hypothetical protein